MAKNTAASVRQKLLNKSREEKRPFQELLQYYAMERFLYRLSQSPHRNCFTLKGALMLWVIQGPNSRPTRDIDMSGQTSNEPDAILGQVREIIKTEVIDDGLRFDPDTLNTEAITEDADYKGIRVTFVGFLHETKVPMQLDIGFGDPIFPFPPWLEFPALLDLPRARVKCYTPESSIAEKFQAMVNLGELNSRMKDFYDIWLLSRQYEFRLDDLKGAVEATFRTRGTEIPEYNPFSEHFVEGKEAQWRAFRKRLGGHLVPEAFSEVIEAVVELLGPVMSKQSEDASKATWIPAGPWHWPGRQLNGLPQRKLNRTGKA